LFLAGTILGIGLSVWLCGEGEKILKQKDPGSIVLDEIVAIPVCGLWWVWLQWRTAHILPPVEKLFSSWTVVLFLFVFFRVFDIAKPWPIKKSQSLPGGWGVTVDDLLAAVYVNVLLAVAVACGIK
jgi:phosphatidylglycerophosphatase A